LALSLDDDENLDEHMEHLAAIMLHAHMAEHLESMAEMIEQHNSNKTVEQQNQQHQVDVEPMGTGRKLLQARSATTDAATRQRLKQSAQEQRRPGCPSPSSLEKECMNSWAPHLTIMGVTGLVGFGATAVGGFEAVFDSQTFEIGFFSFVGVAAALPQASVTLYAGGGYKGNQRAAGLKAAYSGYFLCGSFGGEIFIGVSITACVSGSNPYTPQWSDIKTVVAGLGVSAVPYVVEGNVAVTYFTSLGDPIRCERPACFAAILAFTPGNPISRARVFVYYMERFCRTHADMTECVLYRTTRDFVRNLVNGVGVTVAELGNALRSGAGALRRISSNAIEASRRAIVQGVRQVLQSPELQPPVYYGIPNGRGTYMKLKDCTDMGFTDPYFRCTGSGGARTLSKNTQVGLKNPASYGGSPNYWWVYDRDPQRAGYGLWFPNSDQCVNCQMMDRRTLWSDSNTGYQYSVCSGQLAFQRISVRDSRGNSRGTCNVLYKFTR
jgi:hypothetical protein